MKKNMKTLISVLALISALLLIVSCGAMAPDHYIGPNSYGYPDSREQPERTDEQLADLINENGSAEYGKLIENAFVKTSTEPVSTFSSDVDTASYTYFRKLVSAGCSLVQLRSYASDLRTEEMVNYFNYDCPSPEQGKIFGVKSTLSVNPCNEQTMLLKLTLGTEKVQPTAKNNLVFLIDVSGSMNSADKLPLLKKAFAALTEHLDGDDVVSIVTYSGREEVVLDGCSGAYKEEILRAVNRLAASGATNGEAGLKMAYQRAEAHFIPDGSNRIILASDGDLNVGISSAEELKRFVEGKRDSGVFLSVMGFGTGNFKDANMEALADNGNGVYYYIDGETEAEKVFGEDIFKTLYTVAKDVKLQITFNPETVDKYRLIGYENRLLNKEDFVNDRKDAGDLGAGTVITVLYEIVLNAERPENASFATLALRAKAPDKDVSVEETHDIPSSCLTDAPDGDFLFAAAVMECSLIIRDSAYKGQATPAHLRAALQKLDLSEDYYRQQFKDLCERITGNA